jgi:hypothetical protein
MASLQFVEAPDVPRRRKKFSEPELGRRAWLIRFSSAAQDFSIPRRVAAELMFARFAGSAGLSNHSALNVDVGNAQQKPCFSRALPPIDRAA